MLLVASLDFFVPETMAAIFSILPIVSKTLDQLFGTKEDVTEVENTIRPIVVATKTNRSPSVVDVYKLGLLFSKALSGTKWVERNQDKANYAVTLLINGVGYRDNWKGIGTGNNMLAPEPYKYFVANPYTLYLAAVEVANQQFSPLSSSSTATPTPTLTLARPDAKKKHKKSGIDLNALATTSSSTSSSTTTLAPSGNLDQVLNLSTVPTTASSSSLDLLFPATPEKKK
jgi:hypothetical protein